MKDLAPFSIPQAFAYGAQLAHVVSIEDPQNLARVQVQLLGPDADREAAVWARVAVPFAGGDRGAFLIPDVGDEVLVICVAGDPRSPVVIGGLWNGNQKPPETLSGKRVNLWTFTGTNGTRIAITEESQGQETISFETPGGVTGTLTDEAGGKIELHAASTTITMDSSGVTIDAGPAFTVKAGQISMKAGTTNVTSSTATFSGVVSSQVLKTPSVVAQAYTPGAGNVW